MAKRILMVIDLSVPKLIRCPGSGVSFLNTEEAHAVMRAYLADRGPVEHRSWEPASSPHEADKEKEQV
jgi:hypothetical protein